MYMHQLRNNSEYHSINMDNPVTNEVGESSIQETRREPLSAKNKLVSRMKEKMLLYSRNDGIYHYNVCIYKVPEKLLKGNEDAFTPRIVSIGPFHHGKPHLQAMERYKWRCLGRFLKRSRERSPVILDALVMLATRMEELARSFYNDTFDHFSKDDFSEMMMLDGIFIVELFLEYATEPKLVEQQVIFDHRFMKNDILHDMLLLENQLPILVLEGIASFVMDDVATFYRLAHEYFEMVGNTDTLRSTLSTPRHLLDILRIDRHPSSDGVYRFGGKLVHTRSATELQEEAGVKFSVKNADAEDCLLDIEFKYDKGILCIPQVTVNEWTEAFFGNLIAFEQCTRGSAKLITSYTILMDMLINNCEDVDLLVKCGIIKNMLPDNQLVANIFNNLYKETFSDNRCEFYYSDLCDQLNMYSRDYWHQWKAAMFKWKRMLKRDYFSNPWSTISVIAAVILLALTAIQTACSIHQI